MCVIVNPLGILHVHIHLALRAFHAALLVMSPHAKCLYGTTKYTAAASTMSEVEAVFVIIQVDSHIR